jgi:hypothetical protein
MGKVAPRSKAREQRDSRLNELTMETAKCSKCNYINEVKVSSGFKKPENKGRKYFTCVNCQQFNWVDSDGNGQHPSGLTIDYSKTPNRARPSANSRDYASEARGKIRSLLVQALIQHDGLEPLTQPMVEKLDRYVEYAMNGSSHTEQYDEDPGF